MKNSIFVTFLKFSLVVLICFAIFNPNARKKLIKVVKALKEDLSK